MFLGGQSRVMATAAHFAVMFQTRLAVRWCSAMRSLRCRHQRGLLGLTLNRLLLVTLLLGLFCLPLAIGDSLWDGETPEFWEKCKGCTSARRVFCFTTGECLDLSIDAPSEVLWKACMNPLLIPESCRTKGIHPPGTPREVMENWDREL
mmetsp:Transcript_79203/g.153168  ORF Transcript_79203/g.153168 Transcript_79203/m.153168 type:complete len:149 (+) Transcript_79203:64-510(+)